MNTPDPKPAGVSRRTFLKTTATATAGLSAGLMASGNYAYAAGNDTIRVGLVGCGGRGTGAARDAVQGSDGVVIHAMGDLFEDRLDRSVEQLQENIGEGFQVTPERQFIGFDAYRQVIDSGIDMVILATPPGYRPLHLRAAVEAGKHIFMEKPIAVDSAGVRSVMESSDLAEQRGLAIVAGTQRRHDPAYLAAMQRIHDGQIGEVLSAQVFWNSQGVWLRERKPGMSDMEWQNRNWYYFTWLCGDHIVEQHIHNIDVANWALRGHPVKALGVGGRIVRTDPSYGHIFDHFCIDFEYANGARVMSMCRHWEGTPNKVSEHIIGSMGTSDGHSYIAGASPWEYDGEKVNPYVQEHTNLVNSIRAGRPLNEGRQVAESTLTAIMGREAAYTGQEITWDEILNADLDLVPKTFAWGSMPMPPVPQPGVTTLSRPAFANAG